jgi:putative Mg2+ transporter-C (MgtC) family protein
MIVSLGSALFALMTLEAIPGEIARIIAGVATGIGFLGAGTIFRGKDEVFGLTTAASVWTVAAIGLAVGLGYYLMSTLTVILVLIVLQLNKVEFFQRLSKTAGHRHGGL